MGQTRVAGRYVTQVRTFKLPSAGVLVLSCFSCCHTSVKQKFFINSKLIQLGRDNVWEPPLITHSFYSWTRGVVIDGETFCTIITGLVRQRHRELSLANFKLADRRRKAII